MWADIMQAPSRADVERSSTCGRPIEATFNHRLLPSEHDALAVGLDAALGPLSAGAYDLLEGDVEIWVAAAAARRRRRRGRRAPLRRRAPGTPLHAGPADGGRGPPFQRADVVAGAAASAAAAPAVPPQAVVMLIVT